MMRQNRRPRQNGRRREKQLNTGGAGKRMQLSARRLAAWLAAALLFAGGCCISPTGPAAQAAEEATDIAETSLPVPRDLSEEERRALPIESNAIANWPNGPQVSAQAAILMEVNTGTILYAKNIHESLYPASTTKLLTCLLAVENAGLNEKVTFSRRAVFSVPPDGSSIGIDVGEALTMEEALYGIMVGSANEVANAVGEHIAGDPDAFAQMMNERAGELGCVDSHFVNANGLFDPAHYTSVYDLALIGRAFFSNPILSRIGNTKRYHFTPTPTQPDDFYLNNKHKLITGEIAYQGILGGKTGYTMEAMETLVTCAERDGLKLVCAVMRDAPPKQFTDTTTLFDYGFNNFRAVDAAGSETRYLPENGMFFEPAQDIFGSSGMILRFAPNSQVILPKTAEIGDAEAQIVYEDGETSYEQPETVVAEVRYTYGGADIGTARLLLTGRAARPEAASAADDRTVYIDVRKAVRLAAIAACGLTALFGLISFGLRERWYERLKNRRRIRRRKRELGHKLHFPGSGM